MRVQPAWGGEQKTGDYLENVRRTNNSYNRRNKTKIIIDKSSSFMTRIREGIKRRLRSPIFVSNSRISLCTSAVFDGHGVFRYRVRTSYKLVITRCFCPCRLIDFNFRKHLRRFLMLRNRELIVHFEKLRKLFKRFPSLWNFRVYGIYGFSAFFSRTILN